MMWRSISLHYYIIIIIMYVWFSTWQEVFNLFQRPSTYAIVFQLFQKALMYIVHPVDDDHDV